MLEEVGKNLWLLLTIVIPGLFTYGAWRVLLLLEPSKRITIEALKQMDDSALVTTCIIFAIALLQQAVSIVIETVLTLLAKTMKNKWPNLHALFCERFVLVAAGKLSENAIRTVGNFFLSTNICIGIVLLLIYFQYYETIESHHWIIIGLKVLLAAAVITAIFRMFNAKWIIEECKKGQANKSEGRI